jgi:hypothetical protein
MTIVRKDYCMIKIRFLHTFIAENKPFRLFLKEVFFTKR